MIPVWPKKMIRDKQMTIIWHLYVHKVSHMDKDIIDALIQWIKDTYSDIKNLNHQEEKYMIIQQRRCITHHQEKLKFI